VHCVRPALAADSPWHIACTLHSFIVRTFARPVISLYLPHRFVACASNGTGNRVGLSACVPGMAISAGTCRKASGRSDERPGGGVARRFVALRVSLWPPDCVVRVFILFGCGADACLPAISRRSKLRAPGLVLSVRCGVALDELFRLGHPRMSRHGSIPPAPRRRGFGQSCDSRTNRRAIVRGLCASFPGVPRRSDQRFQFPSPSVGGSRERGLRCLFSFCQRVRCALVLVSEHSRELGYPGRCWFGGDIRSSQCSKVPGL